MPGHPGCELKDPSGLPEAVDGFYRDTQTSGASLTMFAAWSAPRAVFSQAILSIPDLASTLVAMNNPIISIGFGSTIHAVQKGVRDTLGQVLSVGSGVVS